MCRLCEEGIGAPAPSRRGVFRYLGAAGAYALAAQAVGIAVSAKETKAPPKPQNVVSPDEALDLLKEGNARYVKGVAKRHDFHHEREPLTRGQNPFASILSCADLRIAPEYAFDSARGDLFVCRVAGNFANDDVIASSNIPWPSSTRRSSWCSGTRAAAPSTPRSNR